MSTLLAKRRRADGSWKTAHVCPDLSRTHFIYFIQAETGGPIKIGRSKRPTQRLKALQLATHEPLVIRRTVAVHESQICKMERNIHKHFAHARLTGEWFKPVSELNKLAHAHPLDECA